MSVAAGSRGRLQRADFWMSDRLERGGEVEFKEVARFSSRLEAESVGHALDQYDIPFMVQSADVGMFGPGMTGWSPQGASLMVPADRVEEVHELLSCIKPLPEDTDPSDGAS